eukprot:scaffold30862_cov22-Tisochrysis_lutea.AAC.6
MSINHQTKSAVLMCTLPLRACVQVLSVRAGIQELTQTLLQGDVAAGAPSEAAASLLQAFREGSNFRAWACVNPRDDD